MMKLVYILLALGFFKCILLYKLYNSVPAVELKRQARSGNKRAEALYKLANYEASLDVFLLLLGTVLGVILITWSARTNNLGAGAPLGWLGRGFIGNDR
jgi:hypothetical protein